MSRAGLRFDKVALGLVRRLQASLESSVPDDRILVVTCTAPIRLAAKTAAALEEKIRSDLARRSAALERTYTIHGNRLRVRLVTGGGKRGAKVVGFVHNPASDSDLILDVAQSVIEQR